MKILREVMKEEVVDITCDICGNSCAKCGLEYAELRSNWGYDSKKDGEQHTCEICETCYDKLRDFIESLGGKIQVKQYM